MNFWKLNAKLKIHTHNCWFELKLRFKIWRYHSFHQQWKWIFWGSAKIPQFQVTLCVGYEILVHMSKNMKLINFKQSANLCHLVSCVFLSCETRVEKLSALNFRLLSPETWKSWHWVSGNQELPPDFHLQSWQKFPIGLKDKTKNFHLQYWKISSLAECQLKSYSTICKRFPFVVILYLC